MNQNQTHFNLWKTRMLALSFLLPFFAIPHALEDFMLGEPAKNGAPVAVLAFVIAGTVALQGLGWYWAGREDRRSYFIHMGVGAFWSIAAGIAQLPVLLTSSEYRFGAVSVAYVAGMVIIGSLLTISAFLALRSHKK